MCKDKCNGCDNCTCAKEITETLDQFSSYITEHKTDIVNTIKTEGYVNISSSDITPK